MKSSFNWVGNKYKFLPLINEIVKDKSYNMVIDSSEEDSPDIGYLG